VSLKQLLVTADEVSRVKVW